MISYVSGVLAETGDKQIVVETGGMGYAILVPAGLAAACGIGEEVKIYTHLHVSEDALKLYGFASGEDRELFRQLISVSGVGPKVALGVMSAFSGDEIRMALISEDDKKLAKAPGLGAKTARKLILELKDKVRPAAFSGDPGAEKSSTRSGDPEREEAVQALMALGYGASEAMKAIGKAEVTDGMTAGTIVRLALKELAR